MKENAAVRPGQIFRHFKNRLYQVIAVAEHTETGETLVIYQALYGTFGIYARPYEMFVSPVDRSKYSYEEYPQEYRFEAVSVEAVQQIAASVPEQPAAETLIRSERGSAAKKQPEQYLMAFLESDSYREKLEILHSLGDDCTESVLQSMAISLDMGLRGTTVEECMTEIERCLRVQMKYEGRR